MGMCLYDWLVERRGKRLRVTRTGVTHPDYPVDVREFTMAATEPALLSNGNAFSVLTAGVINCYDDSDGDLTIINDDKASIVVTAGSGAKWLDEFEVIDQ